MTLATPDDVAVRLGSALLEGADRIQVFIEDASALGEENCTGAWDRTSPPPSSRRSYAPR